MWIFWLSSSSVWCISINTMIWDLGQPQYGGDKMVSYQSSDSRYKDKTVSRPSYHKNGVFVLENVIFILKQGPGDIAISTLKLFPAVTLHSYKAFFVIFITLINSCGIWLHKDLVFCKLKCQTNFE